MTGNNPKKQSMLMCIQNVVRFCQFVLKTLSGNEILMSIKGYYSVNFKKKKNNNNNITGNNPQLDLFQSRAIKI